MQGSASMSRGIRLSLAAACLLGSFFAFAKISNAALSSPALVAGGTGYGVQESLGWRPEEAPEDAFFGEKQSNRRVVYVEGLDWLVAGVVNTSTDPDTLEFRVSKNKGLTWVPALEGVSTSITLGDASDIAIGSQNDYTLYLGPNKKDVWVSYAGASFVYIQKLGYTPATSKWTLGTPLRPRDGARKLVNSSTNTDDAGVVAVAVDAMISGGSERLWGIVRFPFTPVVGKYWQYSVVRCDSDCGNENSWVSVDVGHTRQTYSGYYTATPHPRFSFFPIGHKRIAALAMSFERKRYNDGSDDIEVGGYSYLFQIATQNINLNGIWHLANVPNVAYAFSWDDNLGPSGSLPKGILPFDYSIAAKATGDLTSKISIAFVGGHEDGDTYAVSYEKRVKVRVVQCPVVEVGVALSTCNSKISIGNTGEYDAPSVGYEGDTAWLAMRGANSHHLSVSSQADWDVLAAVHPASNFAQTPSLPNNVPVGFLTNAGLPPIIWSMQGSSKIVASANIGGTSIGTPAVYAYPVLGFGWSSNFGWLAMNCASYTGWDCAPDPYGTGIGIGSSSVPTAALPFSPSSTNTFPFGGYAWSSNAGWLSFEREDSVCDSLNSCTGGENNPFGNPPGQAYYNCTPVMCPTPGSVPIAKYDKSTQHLHGWGRFLNLCSYADEDDAGGSTRYTCLDKDAGWVRMQGYWANDTVTAKKANGTLAVGNQITFVSDISGTSDGKCNKFPVGSTILVGQKYAIVQTACTAADKSIYLNPELIGFAPNTPVTVYNVTNQPYGVDAYWTGSNYELLGWGWSNEYGWIRFKPVIFTGFAWLETLFGNIYVSGSPSGGLGSEGNVTLPAPPSATNTCGLPGNEPCYVSTYRIDAAGLIQAVEYKPTGVTTPKATSRTIDIATGLDSVTGNVTGGALFPTISNATQTFRNALGKLDLRNLVTPITEGALVTYGTDKTKITSTNRYGNELYQMKNTSSTDWTVGELSNLTKLATISTAPTGSFRSQVVHIMSGAGSENLVIAPGTGDATTTVSTFDRAANTLNLAAGAGSTFPPAVGVICPTDSLSCTIVVNPGVVNAAGQSLEEYFSYTGRTGDQLTGVQSITGKPTWYVGDHVTPEVVRWAWRLPYKSGEPKAQAATIVVDGNLDIQYNILASDPGKDLDTATPATKIRDLPSVAFVVRGNVRIDPSVNRVSGAFVVLGRESASPPDATFIEGGNGGSFFTGDDVSQCDIQKRCNPLVIYGSLFARMFNFERRGHLDLKLPGEQVRQDERLFLNPPPGLADVTKALPNPKRTLP